VGLCDLADCSGGETGLSNGQHGYSRSVCQTLSNCNCHEKIVAFISALAKISSVSYHCEEQKEESMLGRILSKNPIRATT